VKTEEVLHRDVADRNIVHVISKKRTTGLVTFRVGTAFSRQVIEGKIKGRVEVTGRR
jgi:hypothetical protein